eukprot:CAMPEP_0167804234 /NCGR_PEP_ID=MMETSP0111_2-20121227/20351_1 /TAXON_ID=91324 /ORGANISM="Lotharella globosa, Strain CCCM811" /LENGTH=106 /DNA_ID=CAMNT_0007700937 /DNA_START=331 /DNA_END=652 /DNA_ORIENTATION=-
MQGSKRLSKSSSRRDSLLRSEPKPASLTTPLFAVAEGRVAEPSVALAALAELRALAAAAAAAAAASAGQFMAGGKDDDDPSSDTLDSAARWGNAEEEESELARVEG